MNIKIVPKTRRAKNRVHEHGEIMKALEIRKDCIFVESLENTFNKNTEKWMGWFSDTEISWTIIV